MSEETINFITKKEASKKYPYLTLNVLKNLLFKNPNGFREKCVRRLGQRRLLLNERALISFIEDSR